MFLNMLKKDVVFLKEIRVEWWGENISLKEENVFKENDFNRLIV